MLSTPPDAQSATARVFLIPWNLLTNPYCLTAIACGILAVAVSHYLKYDAANPPRDAKPRVVHNDVRRLSGFQFLFASADSAPNILLDTNTSTIYSLHLSSDSNRPSQADPSIANSHASLAKYNIDGSAYEAQPISAFRDVRILEKGLHFHNGRAARLSLPQSEQTYVFQTRVAAETFVNVLNRVLIQTHRDKLSLFLTTFNVGNSQPPDDLSPWLATAFGSDIVAIAAQECSYTPSLAPSGPSLADQFSSTYTADEPFSSRDDFEEASDSARLVDPEINYGDSLSSLSSNSRPISTQSSGHSSARDHWQSLLVSHFPEDAYTCITKQAAWDRCLTVFVKNDLISAVSHVRSDTANVGLGRVAGNKGAIGIRFSVFDTDFVFINSHLAAHHKEVNRRNEDFLSIASGLRGLRDVPDVDILATPVHHFFWMGDLNYRINLERDEVLRLVTEKNWKELQAADQLLQEKSMDHAFHGFLEGETNFPPTYRYEYGSRKYSDVKLRIPSWCDRILYRCLPGGKLELHEYMSADDILTSDHSPVYARFTASLVQTTGTQELNEIEPTTQLGSVEQVSSLLPSPRSLSVRSLLPSSYRPKSLQLVFSNLRAVDIPEMDYGGRRIAVAKALRIENHLAWKKHEELGEGQHADPYCTFHGSAVAELDEGEYRTTTVTASQNPVWKAEDVPVIDLFGKDRKILRKRHVILTVKDENPERRDGTIGSAVIWLGGASDESIRTFSTPIMRGGQRRGLLKGQFFVR